MKNYIFLVVLFFGTYFNGLATPNDSTFLKLVWKTSLKEDVSESNRSMVKPVLNRNQVIFSFTDFSSTFVQSHSLKKGKQKWKWDDFSKNVPLIQLENNKSNSLISENFRMYLFNNRSAKTIWKYETPIGYSLSSVSIKNKKIYTCWKGEKKDSDFAWIMKASIKNPNKWDTLFKLKKDSSNFSSNFSPNLIANFQIEKAKSQKEFLIFQNRSFNFETFKGRIDLYAMDFQTKKIIWKNENIDIDGNSNVNAIHQYDDKIYFIGNTALQVFDIETGTKIWEYKVDRNPNFNFLVGNANIVIDNEKVYLKANGDLLICLNAKTGNVLWENTESGANPNQMIIHNDRLYYVADNNKNTQTTLHVIDAESGKLLHRFISPNELNQKTKGSFNGTAGIAIKDNHLYIGDSFFAMCFKIL